MTLRLINAFILREAAAASANRLVYALPVLLLTLGLLPLTGDNLESAPLFLLQILIYLIPLICVIAGSSAALSDQPENPLLASLPSGAFNRVLGKFSFLFVFFGLAEIALIVPAALAGASLSVLIRIWGFALGVTAVFLSFGLWAGFRQTDNVRAHLNALVAWLLFTFGFGLAAWILSATDWARLHPALWASLLMGSPLDALRIAVLFQIEAVPFATENLDGTIRFWLQHSGLSFAATSLFWTALARGLCRPARD